MKIQSYKELTAKVLANQKRHQSSVSQLTLAIEILLVSKNLKCSYMYTLHYFKNNFFLRDL